MNKLVASMLLPAAALFAVAPTPASAADRPFVVAHRGGAMLLPENTFPAFDNAVKLGVDWLEFDVHVTADDQLVVQHDGKVPGFCSAPGLERAPIRSLSLADALKFDCGSEHRAQYPTQKAVPGTPMPSLDAFFARYAHAKQILFGETKMPGKNEGTVDPVQFSRLLAAAIHKYRLEDRFILQSGDWRTIDAMHEIAPTVRTCLINAKPEQGAPLDLVRQHHASCFLLSRQNTPEQVKQLKDAGVIALSNVDDDDAAWRADLQQGVDAIFTNDPVALIAFLKGTGLR